MGRVVDPETGLIYLRARYYDPTTAQFLTRDPAIAVTGSAYGYVDGNPLNLYDPTGLSPVVLYDITQPQWTFQAAEHDLYIKVWAARGNPQIQSKILEDQFGRRPDLMWTSPSAMGGTVIAEVRQE